MLPRSFVCNTFLLLALMSWFTESVAYRSSNDISGRGSHLMLSFVIPSAFVTPPPPQNASRRVDAYGYHVDVDMPDVNRWEMYDSPRCDEHAVGPSTE